MKTILVDAIDAFIIEGEGIYSAMHKLLETFPNRKIILTGANDQQAKKFGLDAMPYEVFTLKHDPEKSSPEYYKLMLQRFGLSAADVAYFEHDEDAVKSARSIGIKTFHYNAETKDLEGLKDFLTHNL
jgi:HAD superfamily hydrolase (TIGR01509 family)